MKNVLLLMMLLVLFVGVANAASVTYDWSTATGSPGAGTTLNTTSNGNISGANDGWYRSSTTDTVFAVNDNQPVGFLGNYATIGSANSNGWRDNDGNFGYSISSTATTVTLSSVLSISSATGLAWMGLSDSTGGEAEFRIGFFSGNWVYRDNDSTIVSMEDTGVSAVGSVAKSYRVTAVFDLVGNTYDYTVENLSDGGSIALATGVAVDSSVAGLDWSVYDGLRIRGDDASFDSFTVGPVDKATGGIPSDGSADQSTNLNLYWDPALGAAWHKVYLGTNSPAVEDRSAGCYLGQFADSNVIGLSLSEGTTYYWAVDEYDDEVNLMDQGDIWSFTTSGYRVSNSDFDGNFEVDLIDLSWLAARWLNSCTSPSFCEGTDLDNNGIVNMVDFAILSQDMNAFSTTYDFSTATASAGAGTTLNTANGHISGANDGWAYSSTSDNFYAISDNQPAGFSGNYVYTSLDDSNASRLNDSAFSYSIASDATKVILSVVMHIDGNTDAWGWAGLKDISTHPGNPFRIGYFGGNWVYRDNVGTIVSHTPVGDAVVANASQSFRVTAVFDLVGDTYSFTVENLSLGTPGVVLASGEAVTTDTANLDWSVYDGLYMRGRNINFDSITVTSIPEPSDPEPSEPGLINVFFAGGQSNAKAAWADAITAELVADPAYDNVVMVHSYHPGHWLQNWYTAAGAKANYETDFFNASQTGALEAQLAAITAAGDDYVISGFFWFQGEGDTGSTEAADLYESRFMAMLNQIKTDAGLDYDIPFTLAVIDANSAYETPAGRTWAQINYLRNIQQNDLAVAANNGTSVDTRGYARTDEWHLTTEASQSLGAVMAQQHIATFTTDVFFMGGQSNADIEIALGIEDILQKIRALQ